MSFCRKTILVVDSNKTFVLYMSIMLKRMGFEVLKAENGDEALGHIRTAKPDLVVLDSGMPYEDGLDTLVRIRSAGAVPGLPVIMMAADDEELARRCNEAGCNGFLPKPVPMDLLHEYIQDFIFQPLGFRRRHLRVQAVVKVMALFGGAAREFYTETVSEGGAYLRTETPLKVGTALEVTLPYKGSSLHLDAVVIYIKSLLDEKTAIPPGMAVEFRDISPMNVLALNRLVSELIAGDITEADGSQVLSMPWKNNSAPGVSAGKEA